MIKLIHSILFLIFLTADGLAQPYLAFVNNCNEEDAIVCVIDNANDTLANFILPAGYYVEITLKDLSPVKIWRASKAD